MTPQDDWKDRPVRRETSFVEKVTFVGVGLLLGGLTIGLLQYVLAGRSGEDDERPPIIVRNGSIHVEAAHPGSDGDKGKFEKKAQTQNEWHHTHGLGGPKRFTVVATGVVTSAACPTVNFSAQRVTKASLTYDLNRTDRTVDVDIDGQYLRLILNANASVESQPAGQEHILRFDAQGRLKSVTLWFKKKKNDTTDTAVTCQLGLTPEVVFLQHK